MPRRVSSLLALLLAVTAAPAQLPPDKALATFTTSPGLQIELFAAEPDLINPTSMDVDHLGRVWVAEAVNYRRVGFNRPILRPEGDRIVILHDTTGSGKADKSTVFYQGKDLYGPLGLAVAKAPTGPGWKVFVCQSPDILLLEDKDGDGKADGPPTKFLSGFRGFDHDHGVHSVLIGPDMRLYFTVGDAGVGGLKSTDGQGKAWTSNSTDCRAGTVWRCDLDGKNLELIAHNFRNNYECCVDSHGTVFLSDNDDDGNQQTRICYVMPGGDYGYHPRGPGQTHWHEEQPGVVPKILRTHFGSPTGICTYEGSLLPEKYRGQLLHTDAGPRHVRCYHLKPQGAGYDVEREDMVQSSDNWFRPSDVCVGPDGSVFVADWYDPGVGGHGMGDWTRGRIYRVTPKGHQGHRAPKVELGNADGVLAALGSPNLAVRYLAMAQLLRPENAAAGATLQAAVARSDAPTLQARARWLLARREADRGTSRSVATLRQGSPEQRIQALRMLADFSHRTPAQLCHAIEAWIAKDESAAVRREALLLLRDAPPERAGKLILELAQGYDGKDRFYLAALGIAVGHRDAARRGVVLADFDKHFPELDEKTLDIIWELRPPSVLPRLEKQLTEGKLTPTQRGRAVDILAASDDPKAGLSLLQLARGDAPEDVRERAVENLKLSLAGKWRDLRRAPEVTTAIRSLLDRPDRRTAGLALVAAAERQDLAARVAELAAAPGESATVRTAAVRTLGALPGDAATTALERLLAADAPALRLEAVQALGSQLAARRNQPSPAQKPLQTLVTDDKADATLRNAALAALAGSPLGTTWLLDLNDKKQLPETLRAETARLLRNSPFQGLRNRALVAFPPPGRIDPKKLPGIAALAVRQGNAARGKKLLADSLKGDLQCLRCHTVRGHGGQVGPDLSVIGQKASRENLLESILVPNKAIADQYVTWQVETKKGLAVQGLLMEETPTSLTLRDANGKDSKIDKKEIESRTKSPNSLMPNDIVVFLTEEDLIDVVEYLFVLKTPALSMDWWHVVGPFANGSGDEGLDKEFGPERGVDLKASYTGKSGEVRWKTARPNAQGYVDLQAHYGPASSQTVSYLYRELESPVDQEVTLLLGHDDGSKVWVNGQKVHENRAHHAAAPEQHAVKAKLKKGRNQLLLKVNNGEGPHGLYFTLLAGQEVKRLE